MLSSRMVARATSGSSSRLVVSTFAYFAALSSSTLALRASSCLSLAVSAPPPATNCAGGCRGTFLPRTSRGRLRGAWTLVVGAEGADGFRHRLASRGGGLTMSTTTPEEATETSSPRADDKPVVGSSIAGEKLSALRSLMGEVGVDAYVVPTDDPHLSEYVSDAYARRAYLTGFGGSAGTALVTRDPDGAWLWTDSRYYNEATLQLDADHWKLMKVGQPKTPTIPKFLADLAAESRKRDPTHTYRIGIDPFVHPATFAKEVEDALSEAAKAASAAAEEDTVDDEGGDSVDGKSSSSLLGEIDTLDDRGNLIDAIWGTERPPVPSSPFRVHPIEYAGASISDKIEKVRAKMDEEGATLCVFPALDDVAYLLNLRATGDVECNPVGIAYCAVSRDDVILYCDGVKVESEAVRAHLEEGGVIVAPYGDVTKDVSDHLAATKLAKVWIDKGRCNYAISRLIPEKSCLDKQNPVTPMKACKNAAEMEGMRRAHLVDGVAMAKFMSWLEEQIVVKDRKVSEVEIDEVLTGLRSEQEGFLEVSFPTIAGVGSNGAIIHYRARPDTDLLKFLDADSPILIDSGGQYEYGTTDVTRTWHMGEPTDEFREYYTRVLKGNIGVDSMSWPEETPGFVLDVMARKSLWDIGRDYGHGTGHGVGAALNVHEGPQSISPRFANKEPLREGMIVSNEPGYYEDGRFGIRIENLLEIVKVKRERSDDEPAPEGQKQFLRFQKLTLIPIQKNLIDVSLMTEAELDWLDDYHAMVFKKVGPLLEDGSPAKEWLRRGCGKIERLQKT